MNEKTNIAKVAVEKGSPHLIRSRVGLYVYCVFCRLFFDVHITATYLHLYACKIGWRGEGVKVHTV